MCLATSTQRVADNCRPANRTAIETEKCADESGRLGAERERALKRIARRLRTFATSLFVGSRRASRGKSDTRELQQSGGAGGLTDLIAAATAFRAELGAIKHSLAEPGHWYPYDTLSNIGLLDQLLSPQHRDLRVLAGDQPVADIGAADGDLAFFLARHGFVVDILDWGPTNWNHLGGARLLAGYFDLPVTVHEIDLDSQFGLPRSEYGLAFFLGILYHLQNPFYVLSQLSRRVRHLFLSTKIARVTADGSLALSDAPVAYLVAPAELNNDPTNYWIFSPMGLRRILERTGWRVLDEVFVGHTGGDSDPSSPEKDERGFYLLASRQFEATLGAAPNA
jgi:tRNA (mo5U34)-methyltransferase